MELLLGASPSPEITLSRYDPALFPKFRPIFDGSKPDGPLRFLVREPEEANTAVVMQNSSERDITALRYNWFITDEEGSEREHIASADSYMVNVYHPVLGRGDRKLIMRSTAVDESLLDHVLRGGGVIGSGIIDRQRDHSEVKSIRFEIDFVLFIDGEIAGPDRGKYAAELHCRKPAADFVAKQIRLAESEGRDVIPVLSAVAEMPHIGNLRRGQGDPLVHWVQKYARDYLHTVQPHAAAVNTPEARLRQLENRPIMPKFYRRQNAT